MKKIKMLVIHSSFYIGGGAERFLLNFLNIFTEKYDIDLLLFDDLQDNAKMYDYIPKEINVLPPLWQFSHWSPALIKYLVSSGQKEAANIREFVHERNQDPEFRKLPNGERLISNWNLLKTLCPHYAGYDYAIAFTHTLPCRILDGNVQAKDKCLFVHNDFDLICSENEDLCTAILSEHRHYVNMDSIICVTEKNKASFAKIFPDLENKLSVLLNVSDTAFIKKSSMLYMPDEYDADEFNILTVARVDEQKNTELLLSAAAELKKRGMLFKWFILGHIGERDYAKKCLEMRRLMGLRENVVFLGETTNPYPYYKNCSLFVITSKWEGRSLAIEEAMILGCPIVSTNFTSVYDQITDGLNGKICEMNCERLSDAIEQLYHDNDLRNRLANANAGYTGDAERLKYLEFFS